jgi:signal transduction histidine kinase
VRLPDFSRSTSFRLAVGIAGAFSVGIFLLFGFVYWQAAHYLARRLDDSVLQELDGFTVLPREKMLAEMAESLRDDFRRNKVEGLFAPDGKSIAGNMERLPQDLTAGTGPHQATVVRIGERGGEQQTVRVASRQLSDGTILVAARNIVEVEEIGEILARALGLGLIPALFIAILAGAIFSTRANRRVEELSQRTRRIVAGGLKDRLPVRNINDPFDKLGSVVNKMLDDIERLIHEIAAVGDDIAHDLRTPLSRVRVTLERGRENAETIEDLRATIDRAITGLDQSLAIIIALLRIVEIEHGRRLAGFGEVAVADLLHEVVDLYTPMAEDRGIELRIASLQPAAAVRGDRELLFEALANLVDNSVKFTPVGGRVELSLVVRGRDVVLSVCDTGPGISDIEREMVTRRFYRSEKSRHAPGFGLGLSLVSAILKLHGFTLIIGRGPGCIMEIICSSPEV